MARISTYGVDAKPELQDKVIGTDTNPGANLRTKNYSLQEIVDLFNQGNSIAVADQAVYFFQTDISEGRDAGTLSFPAGGGVGTAFSDVTSVLLSKTAAGNKNVTQWLELFANKGIILAEVGSINNFGQYNVYSIVDYPADNNFYEVNLTLIASNGVLAIDGYYIFSEFAQSEVPSFIFTQPSPSVNWNIQHNMDKYPSVSVVNNNNVLMYGKTTYIDKNNLTINFSAGFSGKAYLN